MSLLDELGAHLAANGIGTVGTDIFLSFTPDGPDVVVALYEDTGSTTETFGGSGAPVFEEHSLQVRVRAGQRDQPTARTKAKDVADVLMGITNETVQGHRYLRASKDNGPFLLMSDGEDRPTMAMNFTVLREYG